MQFLNEYGYTIWTLLALMIMWVVAIKNSEEPITPEENEQIMESVSRRENSFLMDRTKSRWGED